MNTFVRTLALALLPGALFLPTSQSVFADDTADTSVHATFDTTLTAYTDFYGITGGAVAVLREEKLIFEKTFGDADVALRVPVTTDTLFQLSSTTKIFTATLMTMLAEEGLVEFGHPVRHYLPELPEAWSDVLVVDIMSHLSGLPEVLECDENEDRDAALSCVFELERSAPRREGFSYNQTNYMLVMMIIEAVTGESFPDALSRRLIEPAGMSLSVLNGDYRDVVPGRATSYYPNEDGGLVLRDYEFPWFLLSAAGFNVSLTDMIAFSKSLSGEKLLGAKWKTRMWSPPLLADGKKAGYALGWDLDELRDGHLSAGHEGGMLTTFRVYPDAGLSVVVLTNGMHEFLGLDELADALAQSADADILTPLDSVAYRAKLQYMESGLDATHAFIAAEICAEDELSKQDCSELLEWLAEELADAGHADDAAELLKRFGAEALVSLSSQ
jgi:CubicO group peptidase (beta-lactamase class C family)